MTKAEELLKMMEQEVPRCSNCGTSMVWFSGVDRIPAYYYCPECMDFAYDEEGEAIGRLE